jgi:hypothetical protein
LLLSISLTAKADDCEFIRAKLLIMPAAGGIIEIPEGTFNCDKMIVVKKSHVTLRGAGRTKTVLRLSDSSHVPVLVIGDEKVMQNSVGDWVTVTKVTDVEVSDLTVDGNLANQDPKNECAEGVCDGDVQNIRNNAITIRGSENVRLLRVTAHSAISGGLVTEKYCRNLVVKDFISYSNYFDGFAGYQTEDSLFENMNLSRNRGAGISIDIDFNKNHFLGGMLANNGDVGIFMRDSNDVIFEKLNIVHNGNHGVFLANNGVDPKTCANRNEFRSVLIENSRGQGIHIASPCVGNKLTEHSIIQKNEKGCYYVDGGATLTSDSTVRCVE